MFFVKSHIPKTHTIIPELDQKKLPLVKVLKELVKTHNCENLGSSKDTVSRITWQKSSH